ncbi:MAG: helix-turn-helix transcriptional regulator, partial [Acetivibrio ethanolgignens]
MNLRKDNEYIRKIQTERIKECMAELNLRNIDIANELNYTTQPISYVLNGKRNLTPDLAIKLANFFNKLKKNECSVKIPFKYLSEPEKEMYADNISKDGYVTAYYSTEYVNYKYLLGDTNYVNSYQQLSENDEYYVAAEPPVRCGESHHSGQTEPP